MVDNLNPTSQFHPYQPQDATPARDRVMKGGLGSQLSGQFGNQLNKVRGLAQKNPSLVLGGLAALVIGAGLMRRRGAR